MSETPAAVGTWIFTLVTPIGELNPEMTLSADGTGRAVLDFWTVEILDAAYDGDSVTFSLKVRMPMGDIDLTVAATVAGDDLTGSVSGSVGTFPLTGVRQS